MNFEALVFMDVPLAVTTTEHVSATTYFLGCYVGSEAMWVFFGMLVSIEKGKMCLGVPSCVCARVCVSVF